ncbi:MAG: hypothetical protein QOK24_2788 [Verrucomicrobiota bacterium]|jgi:hypothetical protein
MRLGLYQLLAPQFLLGFKFEEYIDSYLSTLGIDELRTAYDEHAVVYTGTATFTGAAGAEPVRQHRDPTGAVFEWEDVTLRFRLTLPRDGAAFIQNTISATSVNAEVQKLGALFDDLGLAEDPAISTSDYPGVRFRLELLVTALTFHLSRDSWVPGQLSADHRVVAKQLQPGEPKDVRFILPKLVLVYEQGDDLSSPPSFRINSWGNSGFDAPADLAQGELVRMEPPIALHRSERFAFGIDQVLLDLSPDHTPPEILSFFGTDEEFEGIYVKSARVYYKDENKDFAINVGINDLLISFRGEVSLEGRIDFLGPQTTLNVGIKLYNGNREIPITPGRVGPVRIEFGRATVLNTSVVQLIIAGGVPPYTVSVKFEPTGGAEEELWNPTARQALISPQAPLSLRAPGTGTLKVVVDDSGVGTALQHSREHVDLIVQGAQTPAAMAAIPDGAPSDRPPEAGALPPASFSMTPPPVSAPSAYSLFHSPSGSGTIEQIIVLGNAAATATVNGNNHPVVNGRITLDVPEATSATVVVTYPATSGEFEDFNLYFDLDKPDPTLNDAVWNAQLRPQYANDQESPYDASFSESTAPNGGVGLTGVAALSDWIANHALSGAGEDISIDSYASFEQAANAARDQRLSDRRRDVAQDVVRAVRSAVSFSHVSSHGHFDFNGPGTQQSPPLDEHHRVARIHAKTVASAPAVTLMATISRPARPAAPAPPPTPQVTTTNPPQPPANRPPGIFRRLSFRIRLERNVPVLLEVSGELDFETEMDSQLRQQTSLPSENLGLTPQPNATRSTTAANPNPADGVVDFVINVTYDPAVHALTETLSLGAAPDDLNGLLQMTNPHGATLTTANRFKDAFGGVLMLAPVINNAAAALDPNSAGDWAVLGASLVIPATIGGLGILRTEKITLYGGELKFRQFIPPGEALNFTDAGVIFDYGIEFGIKLDALGISTRRPLKVRYKAVGFNLHFGDPVTYQPIFDTSKGYELDLGDAGLFALPAPLDEILKILAVRIARFNPLTLEVDLGMKVDLGVVQVDRFKVKWPINPLGVPTILPTSARIEIPGTLIGSGSVNIIDAPTNPPPDAVTGGGFDGVLDVSLVALKLRIAASLGVRDLNDPANNRRATAVFAGLIVDFPTPLPIAQSGVGLTGLSGLFAMHYKRLEPPPVPQDSVGPALHWLADKAQGEPAKLIVNGVTTWGPELDKWSFGLGVALATMEGGFLAQLRGMFVLELPGPRILIFVKITIVTLPTKGLKPAADLKTGILGVIDLDLNLGTFTVGVIVDFEVEKLLTIKIPIELFFNLKNASDWHFYLGTFSSKITARVLNLVDAYGYFMVSGKEIIGWPGYGALKNLPGVAVAAGLSASLTIGDVGSGLYLRVAAGADLGVAFSPFFMVGRGFLEGELRLFIVSIEARGDIDIEAPDPTFVHARICGKVSFFFFDVEGCVELSIGDNTRTLPAPPLVTGVYLQSHAPVLTAGQAGDGQRPIDGSLGNAQPVPDNGIPKPIVPIDSVLVIQLHGAPEVGSASTFTEPLKPPPFSTPGYYLNVGGGRKVKYVLKEIRLDPPLPTANGIPPATWRPDPTAPPGGAKTNIDLALMSRVPLSGERAIERSSDLHEMVNIRWGDLCTPVAPAVCVLWTFCGQRLGPSGEGWLLQGTPEPDPPGTVRGSPAPTELKVEEPEPTNGDSLANLAIAAAGGGVTVPAEVIGPSVPSRSDFPPDVKLQCLDFGRSPERRYKNPWREGGLQFDVRNFDGLPVASASIDRVSGFVGLNCAFRTIITLSVPSRQVDLTVVSFAAAVRATAFDRDNNLATVAQTTKIGQAERLQSTGRGIIRVVIDAPKNETLLLGICTEPQERIRHDFISPVGRRIGDPRLERLSAEFIERDTRRVAKLETQERVAARVSQGQIARTSLPLALERLSTQQFVSTREFPTPLPGLGPEGVGGAVRDGIEGKRNECYRALKLPMRNPRPPQRGFRPNERLENYFKTSGEQLWVTLDTGAAVRVQLLLALTKELASGGLRIRQLTGNDKLLEEASISSFVLTSVTGVTTGLPAEWTKPTGPWAKDVVPAATFLASAEFSDLQRVLLTIIPKPETRKIQLVVPSELKPRPGPGALLSVIEICPRDEVERQAIEEQAKKGELETLTGYLNGDPDVPLLEKDTDYTLSVKYNAVSRAEDSSESTEVDLVQKFHFHTDDKAPRRIDPWMLATTPKQEERDVFYEDQLKLVFNDTAIVQLFKAYGKKLRAVLRAADGVAIPSHEIQNLDETPADLTAPYQEFLLGMVGAGIFDCAGALSFPSHGTAVLPLPLRPLMSYTLDLEVDPADPPPTTPVAPLFRRSFTTGRFANPKALVDDLIGRGIRHRALATQISGLPNDGVATVATDEALQAALINAGEQALPAATEGGVVIYWARRSGESNYSPHAILVDSPEALWRTRYEPTTEVVPGQVLGQEDPAYKRIVPAETPAMFIAEQGGANVDRFVRSPSGTRTLALVSDSFSLAASNPTLNLVIQRPASQLYALAAESFPLLTIPFGPRAPWEEDE